MDTMELTEGTVVKWKATPSITRYGVVEQTEGDQALVWFSAYHGIVSCPKSDLVRSDPMGLGKEADMNHHVFMAWLEHREGVDLSHLN
tara:strand:- start:1170 stop:1433 length:264 start_codon:yes stop_codon:yes gene_type:complete